MKKAPNEDVTKLPKWAQQKIRSLEGELRYAKETLRQIESPEGTRIQLGYDIAEGRPRYLPEDVITFKLGEGISKEISVRLNLDDRTPRLSIHGHDIIAVAPIAANSVEIHLVRL